jgi:hypothetical protein
MGSGTKKKGAIDMGSYSCKLSECDARDWGIRNGIYIAPFAKSPTEWYITINVNGKISTSPETYGKVEIWKQIYKYYLYYYSKYTKQEIKEEPKVIEKQIKKEKVINDNLKLF